MNPKTISVVSMLVKQTYIQLITDEGDLIPVAEKDYNLQMLIEDLTSKLTGTTVVEVNLFDYSHSKTMITNQILSNGIVTVVVVDGKEVEGIFYPSQVNAQVTLEDKEITVENLDRLGKHIERANDDQSPSVRNFLIRLAKVIDDAPHTAEDLLLFVENSELPLTDDGLIIAYKRVNATHTNGEYVDVHSGTVCQTVGSVVRMDVSNVDPDRNTSCSHGLHVASLGYLKSFTSSHTMVVLVDPAHFIAVPHGEVHKARVCEYKVVGIISRDTHNQISAGNFAKHVTFTDLIADLMQGIVVPTTQIIEVGQKKVLSVTPVQDTTTSATPTQKRQGKSLLDPSAKVQHDNLETATTAKKNQSLSLVEQAKALFDIWQSTKDPADLEALHKFKRAKKVSYTKLGLDPDLLHTI